MTRSSKIFIIILSIALIIGGFLYYQQQNATEETAGTGVNQTTPDGTPETESVALLDYLQNHPEVEEADLEAVDGSDSSGQAYLLFEDSELKHAVIADMPDPEPGNAYEGWLVQPEPLDFFSAGVMEKNEEGLWVLEFTADQEYPDHSRVVITEETTVNGIPERHVIEGDF